MCIRDRRFDYGDGTPPETVTLGEHFCAAVDPVPSALMHTHIYTWFAYIMLLA